MIINLWSTPRTGSNWYAKYLTKKHPGYLLVSQFLNDYHLYNYMKAGYSDFLYSYEKGCAYKHYFYDELRQSIQSKIIVEERKRNRNQEENYRLGLLDKHNSNKNPIIFYSHVMPMSEQAYKKLFDIADQNIFLYRKNIVAQLSSYALSYGTTQWKPNSSKNVYQNIKIENNILDNLYNRIIYWHTLDKENCKIIAYEDLDFETDLDNLPKKQNIVPSFDQLHQSTKDYILLLESKFSAFQKTL